MKLEANINCPKCRRAFKQRVEDMRPGHTRLCPGCGATIQFTGDDGAKVQRAIDELERTIRQLSGKLTIRL